MGPKQAPFDEVDWETQENTGRSKTQEEQQDGVYSGSYTEKGEIWWKDRREEEGRGKRQRLHHRLRHRGTKQWPNDAGTGQKVQTGFSFASHKRRVRTAPLPVDKQGEWITKGFKTAEVFMSTFTSVFTKRYYILM